MITLAFLLGQAAPTLTFAQVRALPPAVAGDAILPDQQHGPIETFEAPHGGVNAPGVIEGQLVERPVANGPGCARKRWTVRFRAVPGADIRTATVDSMYSTQEIAPASNAICASQGYVRLNPDVSLEGGWKVLASLKEFIDGRGHAQVRCSDTTSSKLCTDSNAIRSSLRTLSPWAITRDANDTLVWMGVPGGIVTEVRFNAARPPYITIRRDVPAPF